MPGNSSPSFIPKRTPQKNRQTRTVRRIYILAYISYVVFFGGLIATAGVFAYELQVTKKLTDKQEQLVAERKAFSDTEMERILELEKRINAVADRVGHNVSMRTLFEAIERSVAETVQFSSLSLTMIDDTNVEVEVEVFTDSFDSTLFQRRILQSNDMFSSIAIEEIGFREDTVSVNEDGEAELQLLQVKNEADRESTKISFSLTLNVPNENILYDPLQQQRFTTGVTSSNSQDTLGEIRTVTDTAVTESNI